VEREGEPAHWSIFETKAGKETNAYREEKAVASLSVPRKEREEFMHT